MNEKIPSLMSLVREEQRIGEQTPKVLSYHLPPNRLLPYGCTSAPTNVLTPEDVELLLSVQEWTKDVELCFTFGAENVAKYQFLCREPFTIGQRTFLSDRITEEYHLAAIIDMVGEDEFDFSGPGLAEIFNQTNLVFVYLFSLEIEKERSMFGRKNRSTNEFSQMPGDEGGERNNMTKYLPTTPDRFHQPINPNNSYTRNEKNEGHQFCDYEQRDTDVGDEDWNEFIILDFEGTRSKSFNNGGHENILPLSTDISVDDYITPSNQPCIVEVGESTTGSTQGSFMNLQFPIQNDVSRQRCGERTGKLTKMQPTR
ncbi:unnamed protein product [Eruca vesicaria subsp. sativa]|uniref:Uncharacterized protein n=1 Tax=Eruca vesicaria subsp. sativa TaxID=29727 RepID=A0ABC8LNJ5_ERUVS|nr:unnamed protein product [Eruca vesicaria subsp. sativa]